MSLIVTMTRLSGGAALRTSSITGNILIHGTKEERLPEVGEYPIIYNGKPLDNPEATGRMVNTSLIVSYEDTEKGREVVTESGSRYLFEINK